MDSLLLVLAAMVGTAATGLFLIAVWRGVFRPATAGTSRGRRAAIASCCVAPVVVACLLAVLDASDRDALAVIVGVTVASIGLGIWLSLQSVSRPTRRLRPQPHAQPT